MKSLPEVFEQNKQWAASTRNADPDFFKRLENQQNPDYLWIGCADSRVPASEICGMPPGSMFVHRNVANVVVHTDMNCLSVLQYAVEVLEVDHVIVCGHYGCGGVKAALESKRHGLIDNWLRNIKDVARVFEDELAAIQDPAERHRKLCERNVQAQVANLCHTTIVQDAWTRGHGLNVHGWIYGLADGLLKDLGVSVSSLGQLPEIYRMS